MPAHRPAARVWLAALLLLPLLAGAGEPLYRLAEPVPAPPLALPDMDGRLHRLSDYRGRPVIVNFWATWCPPCRREMPSMNRAWQQLKKQGVVMLAVNVGEDEDTIFAFTGDYPVDFPILLDKEGQAIGQWPVRGLPTTFVIDPQGRIVYRAVGGREWDEPELMQPVLALRKPHAGTDRPDGRPGPAPAPAHAGQAGAREGAPPGR